ncbi:MAG: hypothetical protein IKD69_05385 [Solobacterium sp.]|nr:hypothetical protein [Solobacterium sp.]
MGRRYTFEEKTKSGDIYVYEAEDEYIPELKQTRKVYRKLLGRKTENGDIVPTRKKTVKTDDDADYRTLYARLEKRCEKKDEQIASLKAEIRELQAKCLAYQKAIRKAVADLSDLPME